MKKSFISIVPIFLKTSKAVENVLSQEFWIPAFACLQQAGGTTLELKIP